MASAKQTHSSLTAEGQSGTGSHCSSFLHSAVNISISRGYLESGVGYRNIQSGGWSERRRVDEIDVMNASYVAYVIYVWG